MPRSARSATPSVRLGFSGAIASILPDAHGAGRILAFGGTEQSHVDLADPRTIRHEYLHRIAAVIEHALPPGEPLAVLHLGAGALTLPRFVQATRPGSPQTVVEIERELPDFVLAQLPLPTGTDLRVLIGDARAQLTGTLAGARFDVIVLDVFSGESSPAHLAERGFYAEALGHLGERGILLVNVGDDAGLRFFARQARALENAALERGLSGAWTLTAASMLDARHHGNLVLAAGPGLTGLSGQARSTLLAELRAAGPHPAAVLEPAETMELVGKLGM